MAHAPLGWLCAVIAMVAIFGLISLVLVCIVAQVRIFYSMARDGLLPQAMGKFNASGSTPYVGTLVTGAVAAVVAALVPLGLLGELVSIGTLLAFAVVCCVLLMASLPGDTWWRLVIWLGIGIAVYACYGRRRSKLRAAATGTLTNKTDNAEIASNRIPDRSARRPQYPL